METETQTLYGWYIVEIMGHQKFVGECSTVQIGGTALLRVDVPETENHASFSKLFGLQSVFCLTPVTEEIGRAMARKWRNAPFNLFDLPEEWKAKLYDARLPAPTDDRSDDDEDYDDEDYDDGDDN